MARATPKSPKSSPVARGCSVHNTVQEKPDLERFTRCSFEMQFLFDQPPASQATFRYTTRHLHGLPMALPGFDYGSRADVITSYLKNRAYRYLESSRDYHDSSCPGILLLCKGEQKCRFLQKLHRRSSPTLRGTRSHGI
ncbi:hypothetical protein OS493_036174 [Desmophyllum pertusum]|uniref:Uncharacterized protein n=1 Tax=Desmophyllum pertusum TaxID=174260 RepID=A0A9X0D0J2_9CNID|nr:hypothetical protein OS493_036174 [Desmophyllum pertusum]